MITLLCPTRGRPKMFGRMVDSIISTVYSHSNVRLFYYTDDNDPLAGEYQPPVGLQYGHVTGSEISTCYKVNKMADIVKDASDILMFASDDMIFATPGWDRALQDHYDKLDNKIHVYHLQDSRDLNGTPHPAATREYVNAMGYFFVPIFYHWFVDTWMCDAARANNCFTHLTDYQLVHDKPNDRGKPDDTHNRIRQMGWHNRDKWVNEKCRAFFQLEKHRLRKYMLELSGAEVEEVFV